MQPEETMNQEETALAAAKNHRARFPKRMIQIQCTDDNKERRELLHVMTENTYNASEEDLNNLRSAEGIILMDFRRKSRRGRNNSWQSENLSLIHI